MAQSIELIEYVDVGIPTEAAFRIVDSPKPEECADGECIVKLLCVSADPYMRGRISSTSPGYISNFELNKPISGFVTAEVILSKSDSFTIGDFFGGLLPYVTIQVVSKEALSGVWKLNSYIPIEKNSLGLGLLGMPGMTAYFGLDRVLQPKQGQTLFVNAAAGAVGSLVGQLAKARGCHVVGSAGGSSKVEHCIKNGFDACIDYKSMNHKDSFARALEEKCPEGIDMYFENVGGFQWNATLPKMNKRSRIAICGCIESYNNWSDATKNDFSIGLVLSQSIAVRGFLVFEWMSIPEERAKALGDLSVMYARGELKADETVLEGLKKFPSALIGLFTGLNVGKMVIRV